MKPEQLQWLAAQLWPISCADRSVRHENTEICCTTLYALEVQICAANAMPMTGSARLRPVNSSARSRWMLLWLMFQ